MVSIPSQLFLKRHVFWLKLTKEVHFLPKKKPFSTLIEIGLREKEARKKSLENSHHDSICIHGSNLVQMKNGKEKLISELVAGDILSNSGKIICVIKTELDESMCFCKIKNLIITPWHPIRKKISNFTSEWIFPQKVHDVQFLYLFPTYIFNFVLETKDEKHFIPIDPFECITLGHHIKNDPICSHSYFGSENVIQDLKRCRGWKDGLIIIEKQNIKRDPITNQINCIKV